MGKPNSYPKLHYELPISEVDWAATDREKLGFTKLTREVFVKWNLQTLAHGTSLTGRKYDLPTIYPGIGLRKRGDIAIA